MPRAVHMLMINDYMLANPALTVRSIRSIVRKNVGLTISSTGPRTAQAHSLTFVSCYLFQGQPSPAHPIPSMVHPLDPNLKGFRKVHEHILQRRQLIVSLQLRIEAYVHGGIQVIIWKTKGVFPGLHFRLALHLARELR